MSDELGENPAALSNDCVRKDQIEYRKWIVSLAMFVLTVSLSVVGLKSGGIEHRWVFIAGWAMLGLCVLLNWLLIKRMVGISLVVAARGEDPQLSHLVAVLQKTNIQAYATLQNLAFLLGVLAICVGTVLNV